MKHNKHYIGKRLGALTLARGLGLLPTTALAADGLDQRSEYLRVYGYKWNFDVHGLDGSKELTMRKMTAPA